ncbi:MAG: serpin family protein [Oligoflexus sp.]
MKHSFLIPSLVLACGIVGGCSKEEKASSQVTGTAVDNPVTSLITERSQIFAFDLLRELSSEERQENVFFSPLSISTALTLVQAGARGETADSIKYALRMQGVENEEMYGGLSSVLQTINAEGELEAERPYDLKVANGIWMEQTLPVNESYSQLTTDLFQAEFGLANFQSQPEAARLKINDWVENQTNNLIQDLFPENSITDYTRMVIANAIYFKGQWETEFDSKETMAMPFYDDSGVNIMDSDVQMMNRLADIPYAHLVEEQVKLVSLPYKGDDVSMVMVLPDQDLGLNNLTSRLSAEKFQSWLTALSTNEVRLTMPKFKVTSSYHMNSYLATLGMGLAFTEKADFSGISPAEKLSISEVFHKAFIEVNEEGTEAAAATGVVVGVTSIAPEPEVFQADRPFLYFIMDNRSQTILFAGILNQPEA